MSTERMWTVERGSYSDHAVLCVCPTKADAKAIAKKINAAKEWGDDAYVGSVHLATADIEPTPTLYMQVNVWDDGTTDDEAQSADTLWPWDYGAAPAVRWRWVRAPIHEGKGGRLEVRGTDFERVRRVFSDRRAQLLAEDAFRMRKEVQG